MKTLLLMRHAKSDWAADFARDHDRPLNDRGVRSARVMGEALASRGLAPDLIISSTATRARSTAVLADEAGGWGAELVLDDRLYGSGPDEITRVAAAAPPVGRLMLVGHQPTWSAVVSLLTGQRVDMKTGTVAVVNLDIGGWDELPSASGRLTEVLQPRIHLDTSDQG